MRQLKSKLWTGAAIAMAMAALPGAIIGAGRLIDERKAADFWSHQTRESVAGAKQNSPARQAAADLPEIYCNVIYSEGNATPVGIYRFTPEADFELEPVRVDDAIKGNGGAVLVDGKYHLMNMMTHYTLDTELGWETVHQCNPGFPAWMAMSATAVTSDPTDGTAYGVTTSPSTWTYVFCKIDYDNNSVETIKDYGGDMKMYAMMSTDKGDIYGIWENGDLAKINKATGEYTIVGSTGMKLTGVQDAVYDPASGYAYWAASTDTMCALYQVDLDDASVSLISEFPNGEECVGLCIKSKKEVVPPTPEGGLNIYCNVIYSDGNATPIGIYKFTPEADFDLEPVKVDDAIKGNGGAVLVNGKYHLMNMMTHYTLDTELGWETVHQCNPGFPAWMAMSATAVTSDPTDGTVYGVTTSPSTWTYVFCKIDYDNNSVETIKDYGGDMKMYAMMSTDKGDIYGIWENGDLAKIDKATGEYTIVGSTGMKLTGVQDAVYDPASGYAYWAASTEAMCALYQVDLSDASVSLISEFPNGEECVGLCILPDASGNNPGTEDGEVTLYGNVCTGLTSGIYSFTPDADLELTEVKVDDPRLEGNKGAVMAGDRYEVVNFMDHYTYDPASWECIHDCHLTFPANMNMAAIALTYDEKNSNIYGVFLNFSTYSYRLCIPDYSTCELQEIGDFGSDDYPRMLVTDNDGHLYGIMANGDLVSVSTQDASMTVIGNTGIRPYGYQGGVTVGGKTYWTASTENNSGLYELDLNDASATLIADFPEGVQMTGVYAKVAKSGASDIEEPAAAENLTLEFENGSLSGMVEFTVASKTASGMALSEDVTYVVKTGDTELARGSTKPGATVRAEVTLPEPGEYLIAVTLENKYGASTAVYTREYIGHDTPEAVSALTLSVDSEGMASLSWSAPSKGTNGAYVDFDNMTYRITRYPGAVVVAENTSERAFAEQLDKVNLCRYRYSVEAVNGPMTSDITYSNYVTVGEYVIPPYAEDFRNQDALSLYTIIDGNNDGTTWELDSWSPRLQYDSSMTESKADDWAVTPKIRFEKDKIYSIQFNVEGNSSMYTQDLSVFMGKDNKATALSEVLVPEMLVTEDVQHVTKIFTVPEDGFYYVGFNTQTAGYHGWICLTDLQIDMVATTDGPAAAEPFSVKAGEKGALEAFISLTVPANAINGTAIDAVTKVELRRDAEVVQTWENPAISETLEYTDTRMAEGMHTYTVVAYSEKGAGYPASADVYVGIDIPNAVEITGMTEVNGTVTLTWSPVPVGIHGGYVDVDALKYSVQRNDGEMVAVGITDTSISDDPEWYDDQYDLAYAVMAFNDKGNSPLAISPLLLFGDNYDAPFYESFPSGNVSHYWGVNNSATGSFLLSTQFSQDGDNGSVAYQGNDANASAEIFSGRIDLTNVPYPYLKFYTAHVSGRTTVDVGIITSDGVRHSVDEFTLTKANTIEEKLYALPDFARETWVQISIIARSTFGASVTFFDNFSLIDDPETNVSDLEDASAVEITPVKGGVEIANAASMTVRVFTQTGVLVASEKADGNVKISLEEGIYVVTVGDRCAKIEVK